MAEAGLEGGPKTSEETAFSQRGGAESGAVDARTAEIDPDLAAVIDAWPTLPHKVKAAIKEMVTEVCHE